MKSYLYEEFEMFFSSIAKKVVEFTEREPFDIFVKLNDGTSWAYDSMRKTIRKLPDDNRSMNEDQCKREFGIRLRKTMERKFVTQRELSSRTGITQAAISNYINGKVSPSFYNADKIAKALNCSIDEFSY